jgi:hypothetical protein
MCCHIPIHNCFGCSNTLYMCWLPNGEIYVTCLRTRINLVSGDAPHVVPPHPHGNRNRQQSTKNWWKWWKVVGRIFAQLEASVGQQYHHFGGKILTTFRQYGLLLFNHVRTHVLWVFWLQQGISKIMSNCGVSSQQKQLISLPSVNFLSRVCPYSSIPPWPFNRYDLKHIHASRPWHFVLWNNSIILRQTIGPQLEGSDCSRNSPHSRFVHNCVYICLIDALHSEQNRQECTRLPVMLSASHCYLISHNYITQSIKQPGAQCICGKPSSRIHERSSRI